MPERNIVKINEELCNGCGLCISPCVEGALVLEDGKAKVIREEMCDGAGFCMGVCPTGALSLEVREAPEFSEEAVKAHGQHINLKYLPQVCNWCGTNEDHSFLIAVKNRGQAMWICSKCLPQIIHG